MLLRCLGVGPDASRCLRRLERDIMFDMRSPPEENVCKVRRDQFDTRKARVIGVAVAVVAVAVKVLLSRGCVLEFL